MNTKLIQINNFLTKEECKYLCKFLIDNEQQILKIRKKCSSDAEKKKTWNRYLEI